MVDAVNTVDVLDELRERRMITQYTVVSGIGEDTAAQQTAAQHAAWVVTELISTAWRVPPRSDERLEGE